MEDDGIVNRLLGVVPSLWWRRRCVIKGHGRQPEGIVAERAQRCLLRSDWASAKYGDEFSALSGRCAAIEQSIWLPL